MSESPADPQADGGVRGAGPESGRRPRRCLVALALAGIVLAGVGLRFWRATANLTYLTHPDEPRVLARAQSIYRSGDVNPHFFQYPSLVLHIHALAHAARDRVLRIAGATDAEREVPYLDLLEIGVSRAPRPGIVLFARSVSIAFGAGTILLAFFIARSLWGRAGGALLAAALAAVLATPVALESLVTVDGPLTFFATASFAGALLVWRRGSLWDYLLAGLLAGLAVSAKTNGGFVLLPLAAAHVLRTGRRSLREAGLPILALGAAAIAFAATNPFLLSDPRAYIDGFRYSFGKYAEGAANMSGSSLLWYARMLALEAGPAAFLLAAGAVIAVRARDVSWMLAASFALPYAIFVGFFSIHNDRTLLPVLPMFCVLAAFAPARIADALRSAPVRRRGLAALGLLVALSVAWPAARSIRLNQRIHRPNARDAAREWIDAHIPAGSTIALEPFGPWLDPSRYRLHSDPKMYDHAPDWFEAQGFEILVFSQEWDWRYVENADRFPAEAKAYEALVRRFPPARRFGKGRFEIRIHPVRRSGASGAP